MGVRPVLGLLQRKQIRDGLAGLALLIATAALVAAPGEAIAGAKDGLTLCFNVIVPSLFPFFVLSSLVVELGMSRYLGRLLEPVMAPLFRVNGSCAAALALGNRTLRMDRGRIVLELSGRERAGMTVPALRKVFKEKVSRELDNDRMLLN